ncbi:MAG: TIR domain-containing protein [Anaerolineae bacterium]|nr:TIR domain-containing protein [Anaerolineae bacterium]
MADDSQPGASFIARSVPPEFAERMRQRRPGYDRVAELVRRYDANPIEERAKIDKEKLDLAWIRPLFQALDWEVWFESGFDKQTASFDFELAYHNLRIPVEVRESGQSLDSYTPTGLSAWEVLTNFESVLIWDLRDPGNPSVFLATGPRFYLADGSEEHDLLAAQVFYERLVQPSEKNQATESPQQPPLKIISDVSHAPKFDAYLSFSSLDRPWVTKLKADLEKYGLSIWLDNDELQPGDDWAKKIELAVANSKATVVVVSPDSMQSKFVNRDIEQVMALLKQDQSIKIIPVLFREAEIPPQLARFLWVDFRNTENDDEAYDRRVWELVGGITGQKPPEVLKLKETATHAASQRIEPSGIPSAEAVGEPQVISTSDQATVSEQVNVTISPPQPTAASLQIAIRALADKPSDVDLLGFKDYAEALADFIKEPKTEKPLTISIDAAWGMGKTSLMRMIRRRLEGQPNENIRNSETGQKQNVRGSFPTVWFNAWKYDEEESLWAALVLEILGQIRRQLIWRQQTWLNLKLNWKRFDWGLLRQRVIKYLAVYIFLVGILGTLTFGIASLWLGATWQESWQKLLEYIQLVGGLGFLTAIYAAGKQVFDSLTNPFDLKLEQYLRQPNYAEKVGFLAQFEADFKRVVDVVTENGKWPLVVFIDDLDRCAPPKPVEIIEAINLLLDSQHCVFILGMDAQTVAGSIEAKYKDLLANLTEADTPGSLTLGQRFLEKIIQINFRIPQVKPEVMVAFIEANLVPLIEKPASTLTEPKVAEAENLIKAEQRAGTISVEAAAQAVQAARPDLTPEVITKAKKEVREKSFDDSEEVKQAIRAAVPYLGFNPRKVKRFINLLRLQALIANRRGLLDQQIIQIGPLSQWLLLASLWPDAVEAIANDPDFVNRLNDANTLRTELRQRRTEAASAQDLKDLDFKNEQVKTAEARLNIYMEEDPLIKQLFATPELFGLLAGLDTASPAAFSQYLHLAQMSVDTSARQQPAQGDVKQPIS